MLTSGWAAARCASPTGCYRHPSTAAAGTVIGQGLGPGCCPLLAKAEPVALRPSLGSAITCHIPSVTRTTLAVGEGTTRRTQPLTALRPTPTAPLPRSPAPSAGPTPCRGQMHVSPCLVRVTVALQAAATAAGVWSHLFSPQDQGFKSELHHRQVTNSSGLSFPVDPSQGCVRPKGWCGPECVGHDHL